MPIRFYNPTTPARRKASVLISDEIKKDGPLKRLTIRRKNNAGRNSSGKITVRHRGGGVARRIRVVDFKQNKYDIPAVVESIEYDPNRSACIALIRYKDGERRYILAPDGIKESSLIVSSKNAQEITVGNRMPLEFIPAGIIIHNLEFEPSRGGQLVRGAGAGAQIMAIEGDWAQVKMPSSEIRLFRKTCFASIGRMSNVDHRHVRIGKAGTMRKKGIRPTVRGKAMNPVDHPHGGGEGKNSIGLHYPKTPWGKHALGVKTRKKKASDRLIIKRRQRKKK